MGRPHDGERFLGLQLSGAPLALFLLVTLAYYGLCEALTGTTLGKGVLGLVVASEQGQRAAWRSVALRTVFRVVDALPIFYLVGFVVSLATPKNQRVGDLVAHTRVVRRQDTIATVPRRRLRTTGVTLAAAFLVTAGAVLGWSRPAPSEHVGRFDYADDVVPYVEQLGDGVFRHLSTDELLAAFIPGAASSQEAAASLAQLDDTFGALNGAMTITDHQVMPDSQIEGFGTYDLVEVYLDAIFENTPGEMRLAIVDYQGSLRLLRWDVRASDG